MYVSICTVSEVLDVIEILNHVDLIEAADSWDGFSLEQIDTTILRSRFKTLDIIGCECIFNFDYVCVFVAYALKLPTTEILKLLIIGCQFCM